MNEAVEKIKERIKGDRRLALIVIAGALGIILLTFSELIPEKKEKKPEADTGTNLADYEENIEKRLSDLVASIEGAGRTRVMVTVDSGDENVYATEDKSGEKTYERDYVVVKRSGDEEGMLLKIIEPTGSSSKLWPDSMRALGTTALPWCARERIPRQSDRR